jgi:hypothetical protein
MGYFFNKFSADKHSRPFFASRHGHCFLAMKLPVLPLSDISYMALSAER